MADQSQREREDAGRDAEIRRLGRSLALAAVATLPLLVILAGFLPAGFGTIVTVLTVTGWAWGARVMRAQTMSLREKDFVSSAIVSG